MVMNTTSNIFISLLRELKIPYTKAFSLRTYEEHPYKYTFFGIKSLCEMYKINTEGYFFYDKAEILTITAPFIADYANDYVLVKSLSSEQIIIEIYGTTATLSLDDFKESWGGNALLFYPKKNSIEPNYEAHKRNELYHKIEWAALSICIIFVLGLCVSLRPFISLPDSFTIILAILGVLVSLMLLSQQLKVHNSLVESVCHSFKKSSCNDVLESSASKILGRYSWSEIGFSYFSVNLVYLLLSNQYDISLAYIGVLAVPYSIWSIWYQRRISQWCPLCLLIQGVIVFQFTLFLYRGYYQQPLNVSMLNIMCILASYIAFDLILHKLILLLTRSNELQQAQWQYNHLRINDKVFHSLLEVERSYPTESSSIIFGDINSSFCITILSNPYCNPCAAMHMRMQKLINETNCQVRYYFTSFKPEWNIINKYMIAAYKQLGAEKSWQLYTEWYDKGKLEEELFFDAYHLSIDTEDVNKEFNRHQSWLEATGLNSTPTLLVNGHKLPYGYVLEDMLYFI